jgi:DNA invertase Pin-like site-specific DNA recombinase
MQEQFIIYARKSTDDADRQVRSIGDQLAEVRELARRLNLKIVDTLVEKQSAKKPGRPVFDEMLRRIEEGQASGILAWHPDRLARNMLDGGRIIHMVDTGKIKDLKFPNVDFQPTSQGKLNLAMLFGMSKYYVDALRRTKASMSRSFPKTFLTAYRLPCNGSQSPRIPCSSHISIADSFAAVNAAASLPPRRKRAITISAVPSV